MRSHVMGTTIQGTYRDLGQGSMEITGPLGTATWSQAAVKLAEGSLLENLKRGRQRELRDVDRDLGGKLGEESKNIPVP